MEIHELLLVECDKDSEFFRTSKTKTGNNYFISACKCTSHHKTNFAPIIATENKANPATDKVYIDNRNHGLA